MIVWEAELGGLKWLDKLVEEKKVVCLQEGYYPSLYTAKAKHVFEVVLAWDKPPLVTCWWDWISKGEYRTVYNYYKWEQEIALCSKEEWLRIEVWDLS